MVSIRDKPWLGGLITGITGLLAILLPVRFAYISEVNIAIWMWGLISGSAEGFTQFMMFGDTLGITISIVDLYLSIIIFTSFITAKKYEISKRISNLWIICGILYLISAMLYLILHIGVFMIPGSFFGFSLFLLSFAGAVGITSGVYMRRGPN
ncbi:MAG: hypothetical protein ACFFKA_19830 [Candidatus Thorarchaeota archaeon]